MCEMHSEEYVRRGNCEEIVSVWSGIKFSKGKRQLGNSEGVRLQENLRASEKQ